MNKQEKKELTLEQKIKGDLMEIKKFTYNELEKGYRGIIDRFGNFYALDEIENSNPIHQKMVPSYLKDNDINIIEKFQNLDLDEKTNILYGNNAQGKTNILESIYVCSTTKSHRTNRDAELINLDSGEAHIKLYLEKNNREQRIDIHLRKNKTKGIAINGIPIKKASELFGLDRKSVV